MDLALGCLHGLCQLRRSGRPRDQDDGQIGGQVSERCDNRIELLVAPALDAVGEQVAPRLGQRHRPDRGQQSLVIGPAPPLAWLEDLQRGGSAIAFRASPQPGPGRVDLRPVGTGDQVER